MTKFRLEGLGTAINSTSYDNESAYKELLSRVNNKERLVIGCFLDRDGYPSIGVETIRVARFKVRINQDILSLVIKYLINDKVEDWGINPNEIELYEEGQAFDVDIAHLLIESGFTPQVVSPFRTKYGYINMTFNFPNGRIYFRLSSSDELLDYLHDKGVLL